MDEYEKLLNKAQQAVEAVIEEQTAELEKRIAMHPQSRAGAWAAGPLSDLKESLIVIAQVRQEQNLIEIRRAFDTRQKQAEAYVARQGATQPKPEGLS